MNPVQAPLGLYRSRSDLHKWGCSSVGRAPALQAGGHEFESHHLHEGIEKCQAGNIRMRRVYTKADEDLPLERAKARDEKDRRSLNRTSNAVKQ